MTNTKEPTVKMRYECTVNVFPEYVPAYQDDGWKFAKRFTDAELAAEYWRARWTGLMHESKFHSVLSDEHRAMIATVERFMELPNYDEGDA